MSGLHWQRRWDPFRDFQREVGRLFETIEANATPRTLRSYPAVNLAQTGDDYILTAQLPGHAPEDVDLSITGETLTLKGERKRPEGVGEDAFRRQERPFGRWTRTVALPERVDGDKVTANFSEGILTVVLPRSESAKPRHINVTAQGN